MNPNELCLKTANLEQRTTCSEAAFWSQGDSFTLPAWFSALMWRFLNIQANIPESSILVYKGFTCFTDWVGCKIHKVIMENRYHLCFKNEAGFVFCVRFHPSLAWGINIKKKYPSETMNFHWWPDQNRSNQNCLSSGYTSAWYSEYPETVI